MAGVGEGRSDFIVPSATTKYSSGSMRRFGESFDDRKSVLFWRNRDGEVGEDVCAVRCVRRAFSELPCNDFQPPPFLPHFISRSTSERSPVPRSCLSVHPISNSFELNTKTWKYGLEALHELFTFIAEAPLAHGDDRLHIVCGHGI